mgnify:CR=1 FL=1
MTAQKSWLWRCAGCGFLHSTLPAGAGTGVDGLAALRRRNFDVLLSRLNALLPLAGKNLLEVGCSTGLFLEAASAHGLIVAGIEPETQKGDIARGKGFSVRDGFFPDALHADDVFDLIVFNDVFEHLPRPEDALPFCEKHLAPGGLLVINLPDSRGILYRIAGMLDRAGYAGPFERLWQKSMASPHITYFNQANLTQFVQTRTGLKRVASFPLDTLARVGLRERIKASVPEPIASLMYAALLLLIPLQRILPSDILVQVFRR